VDGGGPALWPAVPFVLMTHPEGQLALPLAMLLVFGSAKLLGEVFERLRQPSIVGEILAGAILGPSVLALVQPNELLTALAELGVMFLLFRVGLEVRGAELWNVGGTALIVAAAGVAVPMVAGWGFARAWGLGQVESVFIGTALVATSVGITAEVLASKGMLDQLSSRIILAAAVIDDVLGLIVLAIVSGTARGSLAWTDLALAVMLPVIFTVILARWGSRGVLRVAPRLESKLKAREAQFHLALVLLFALSALAMFAGVAAIVGAFLAGMTLADHVGRRVHTLVHGTAELLTPFFLAGIGLQINLAVFKDSHLVAMTAIVIVIAMLTKVIGCGLGAIRLGRADALRIGIGMAPRGEVGVVVAQLGLTMGVVSAPVYAVIVFAALATTVLAPPLLVLAYKGADSQKGLSA